MILKKIFSDNFIDFMISSMWTWLFNIWPWH